MKRALLALAVATSLLGVARRAAADTLDFTFVSTPNADGTYTDVSGTLVGLPNYESNPADIDLLVVDGGMITVMSNVPPTPFSPTAPLPRIPALNGSSDSSAGGSLLFTHTPQGIEVNNGPTGPCEVCFLMPGLPADGGDFVLYFRVSGINGAAGNSELVASDEGTHGYLYMTDGTLTLSGEVGNYDLSPEPPSWLLLGSGALALGLMGFRKYAA